MIGAQHVTFKTIDAQIENVHTGEDRKTMDVCEITYPDGKVVAFPANDVSPEEGRKYSEIYGGKYQAFKNGDPDPDHVKRLEREIAEKQAELNGLSKDDKRVKENLGYGKLGDADNPQQAKAGALTKDSHATASEKAAKHKARA